MSQLLVIFAMLAWSASMPGSLAAQDRNRATYDGFELLSANVIAASLTAGISGRLNGRDFWRSAAQGALGGATMFAGKRIASSDVEASGLVGRQLSALGASVTRSAGHGSGLLDTLFVPIGPLHLAWSTREKSFAPIRLDIEDLAWTIYGLTANRYSVDWQRSVRAGALVFTTFEGVRDSHVGVVSGMTSGGVVFLSEPLLSIEPRNWHHEVIHLAQTDLLEIAVGLPLERWALRQVGWSDRALFRYLDLGFLHLPFQATLRPLLEAEANRFEARTR